MMHKLLLISLVAFLAADWQVPAAMVTSMTSSCSSIVNLSASAFVPLHVFSQVIVGIYLMVLLVAKPYVRKGDDSLHVLIQTELLLVLLTGTAKFEHNALRMLPLSCPSIVSLRLLNAFSHALPGSLAFPARTQRTSRTRLATRSATRRPRRCSLRCSSSSPLAAWAPSSISQVRPLTFAVFGRCSLVAAGGCCSLLAGCCCCRRNHSHSPAS
jgi:hypothetical protein